VSPGAAKRERSVLRTRWSAKSLNLSLVRNSFTYVETDEGQPAAEIPDDCMLMLRKTMEEGSYCIQTINTDSGC
jgi:hypothetical protein